MFPKTMSQILIKLLLWGILSLRHTLGSEPLDSRQALDHYVSPPVPFYFLH